jgi:hypothetical protein
LQALTQGVMEGVERGKELPSLPRIDDPRESKPRHGQVVEEEVKADRPPYGGHEKDVTVFVDLGVVVHEAGDAGVVGLDSR